MSFVALSWVVAIPLLGGLTGLRTMTPMAILCWFCYTGRLNVHGTWAFWTAQLITPIVFTILAAGEFYGDKLPQTPNRIAAVPLLARIAFGSLVGAIAATAKHGSPIEGAVLGGVAALAGAFFGFHMRQHLVHDNHYPDFNVALLEDVLTLGLSFGSLLILTR
jgi:uncharacterized membrane protein